MGSLDNSFVNGDTTVTVRGTQYIIKRSAEQDKKVVDTLIQWYKEVGCMYAECLIQDDDAVMEAPQVLANILDDILKPEEVV
jgi:hypothetical protein